MGSFGCVIVRVANDNFAQDDRLHELVRAQFTQLRSHFHIRLLQPLSEILFPTFGQGCDSQGAVQ
jgi:hypothetical protein